MFIYIQHGCLTIFYTFDIIKQRSFKIAFQMFEYRLFFERSARILNSDINKVPCRKKSSIFHLFSAKIL